MIEIKELAREEYLQEIKNLHTWYSFIFIPRAFVRIKKYEFTEDVTVFINKDALFINARDKELLIEHEIGHAINKPVTPTGIMSEIGIVRLLTS